MQAKTLQETLKQERETLPDPLAESVLVLICSSKLVMWLPRNHRYLAPTPQISTSDLALVVQKNSASRTRQPIEAPCVFGP
jgi:hypothetical protein